MANTDLIERLDRDIQMAERARSEMIEQGHPGWPNAVLFLMETATEARTQLTASRAECEKLEAALEPFAWIGQWLFARDLPDDTPMVTIEGAGKPFNLTRGMFKAAHTALSQKETGNAA
ncbi:MAG: hypothetical protein ACTHKQ_25965 [Mesorhizobium sp.]